MSIQHKELAAGRWKNFTFIEQMANIGSEVERTISWAKKNNPEYSSKAFERALELIDLTISFQSRNHSRLKELTRLRETLTDYFFFDNSYNSTENSWHSYFYAFTFAARIGR